jgi:hypothetical protein
MNITHTKYAPTHFIEGEGEGETHLPPTKGTPSGSVASHSTSGSMMLSAMFSIITLRLKAFTSTHSYRKEAEGALRLLSK